MIWRAEMMFTEEVITLLYKKAVEEGCPEDTIQNIAKASDMDPEEIKKILKDKGVLKMTENVQKTTDNVLKEADSVQNGEDSGKNTNKSVNPFDSGVMLPIPDCIKNLIIQRLDYIDEQVRMREQEILKLNQEHHAISNYMKGIKET